MRNISIDDINAAILNGGAGSLLVRVELEPASGLDGIIAPAKYAGANNATYVYEKRYLGEEKPQKVVLIDSKGSFANRVEETITEARRTGEGLLASMPHIVVKYDDESGSKTYCDSQLPHRGFDGHIRVGVHDGKSTSEAKEYIDARNSTLENLLPLFNKRYGEKEEFEPLTAESTEKLLEEAYMQAREKAGIVWNGQEFLVQGNPAVFDNASAEE